LRPDDPGADCVSYPPVLHQINLALNWNARKVGPSAAKLLPKDEARRIAAIIATLPDMLARIEGGEGT
jgi:hypothetical protein